MILARGDWVGSRGRKDPKSQPIALSKPGHRGPAKELFTQLHSSSKRTVLVQDMSSKERIDNPPRTELNYLESVPKPARAAFPSPVHVLMQASTAENLVSLFRSASTLSFKRFCTAAAARKKVASSSSSSAPAAKNKLSPSSSTPAAKNKLSPFSSAAAANKKSSSSSSVDYAALKKYVSSINISPAVSKSVKHLLKNFKAPPSSTISSPLNYLLHGIVSDSFNSGCRDDDGI